MTISAVDVPDPVQMLDHLLLLKIFFLSSLPKCIQLREASMELFTKRILDTSTTAILHNVVKKEFLFYATVVKHLFPALFQKKSTLMEALETETPPKFDEEQFPNVCAKTFFYEYCFFSYKFRLIMFNLSKDDTEALSYLGTILRRHPAGRILEGIIEKEFMYYSAFAYFIDREITDEAFEFH